MVKPKWCHCFACFLFYFQIHVTILLFHIFLTSYIDSHSPTINTIFTCYSHVNSLTYEITAVCDAENFAFKEKNKIKKFWTKKVSTNVLESKQIVETLLFNSSNKQKKKKKNQRKVYCTSNNQRVFTSGSVVSIKNGNILKWHLAGEK